MLALKSIRIFTLVFWNDILKTLLSTSKRFPLAITSFFFLSFVVFSEIHDFSLFNNKQVEALILLFVGGFLWFSSAPLFCENRNWHGIKKYSFLIIIYLLYCWRIYLDPKITVEIGLLLGATLLSLSFFPRLFRPSDNASSWYYNFEIIAGITIALLAALIFSGGLSLVLLSLGYLFELKINGKFYADVWIVGMMIFAPFYVLAHLPKQFDFADDDCQFPKGVHFILNFAMVPLTLIYMVILYTYFIKILLQWNLPHGHLGWMISLFGVIGILTHLAIYPIHNQNKPLMAWFYRNFYRIMIVPLLLLVAAIGVRVQQYGITELRYFVMLCAVWFVWLIINNLFRGKDFKLTTVTISLATLGFLGSFGPWGVKQLPISNQFSQFEQILQQFDRLKDGKLQPSQQKLDEKTRRSLTSIVDYLARRDSIGKFRSLFSDSQIFDKALDCVPEKPCFSRNSTKLLEIMDIEAIYRWNYNSTQKTVIKIDTLTDWNRFMMLSTKGFDYFIPLKMLYSSTTRNIKNWGKDAGLPQLKLKYNGNSAVTISSENMQPLSFDLLSLYKQFPQYQTTVLKPEERQKMILTASNNQITASLYISEISFREQGGQTTVGNFASHLLIKIKEKHD